MFQSRDVNLLRADVAENCRTWQRVCQREGLNVLITCTVRDDAYQAWLYEQGRTRPGVIVTNSRVATFHWDRAGLAFDFCRNVRGKEYDNSDRLFNRAGAIAEGMGFEWGGSWKNFVDLPHVQWSGEKKNITGAQIRQGVRPADMPKYYDEEDFGVIYKTIKEVPDWGKPTVQKLVDRKFLLGDENGNLNIPHEILRLYVVHDRAGVYGK